MNLEALITVISFSFLVNIVFSQSYYDSLESRRAGGNRRRPCVFKNRPKKGHHQGRTFLDWNIQQYDISYNYNYNIDCSGGTGGGNNHQGLLGSHFQGGNNHQQGLLGSHSQGGGLLGSHNLLGGGSGLLGSLFNKPQGGLISNIPSIPQFGNGISQTQSQSQAGFFPQGIFSSFGNFFNRPPSSGSPPAVQNVPQVTTPSDPDDIIYNDETATPVNTNYDPVPDAYSNGGRPGRPRPGLYYNQNSYYNKLSQYSINRGY
ncbi:uncharacterized protein LOC123317887 [Coccinella septempunctata]|uniref:uncharacterized protein LOC123317887 n=1 Tax=Coccinella septempunctata TaxID=41139 RepID=UPI001D0732F3|nr:uncharacterized protein LOC123317887 [Coccinella septempunctata]